VAIKFAFFLSGADCVAIPAGMLFADALNAHMSELWFQIPFRYSPGDFLVPMATGIAAAPIVASAYLRHLITMDVGSELRKLASA
jgi:hypothetical protein